MRISDWSSDVCSSDLASNASSSVEITGRARSHASARGGKGRQLSAATITCPRRQGACLQSALPADRKSVGSGKSVSVRVDIGGRRIIEKKKKIDIMSLTQLTII